MSGGASAPALETRGLCRRFGGLVATDNVTFRLEQGARHALIGPNGAGKTTFVNLLTGVLAPSAGSIFLQGVEITRESMRQRVRGGLARTFQINQLFAEFSALETLALVIEERDGNGWRWLPALGARAEATAEAGALLEGLGLEAAMHVRVGSLPYGQQRLLEIAIALALKPRVILLDEPAAGVPESERDQILDVLRRLPDSVALLLIEHDMDLVFRFADRISVFASGALFAEGRPADIAASADVKRIYLGEEDVRQHP